MSARQFSRTFATSLVLVTIVICWSSVKSTSIAIGQDSKVDDKSEDNKATEASKIQMAVMKRLVSELRVQTSGDASAEAELIPEALFRSHDPARDIYDGTIWGFGKKGRPAALLSLAYTPATDKNVGTWVYEFDSLASTPVEAKTFAGNWFCRKPGIEFKTMTNAPEPAEREAGRTLQFRDLSTRFTAYEFLQGNDPNAKPERCELRLIPRPVYRYSDPDKGQIDGAIFLLTTTTNPEVILVIELAREGEKNVWKYGFNRVAWAELHVELDGVDVWTQPHLRGTSPAEPYWLFFKRIPAGTTLK